MTASPALGVVLVTYDSAEVILDALESLLAARGVRLAMVVVDNGSQDGTPAAIRDWAAGRCLWTAPDDLPFPLAPAPKPLALHDPGDPPLASDGHRVTLIETGTNGGFAAGVNRGIAHLSRTSRIDRYWILNPDSVVAAQTPRLFATVHAGEDFALMGGRVLYLDGAGNDVIQVDGGTIRRTGVSANLNKFRRHPQTPAPDAAQLEFVSGASMVASRAFWEAAGPMPEDYFLYYEEVDWAMRRGSLPLVLAEGAVVWHRAGTAIGSGRPGTPALAVLAVLPASRPPPFRAPVLSRISPDCRHLFVLQGGAAGVRAALERSLGAARRQLRTSPPEGRPEPPVLRRSGSCLRAMDPNSQRRGLKTCRHHSSSSAEPGAT